MYTIEDDRKTNDPLCYVLATDDFMSGWGHAPNRSLYAFACKDESEAERVEIAMNNRDDFKRVRRCYHVKKGGTPRIQLESGDHLKIVDAHTAPEFLRGAAAFS